MNVDFKEQETESKNIIGFEQLKSLTKRKTKVIELNDVGIFKIRALSAGESADVMSDKNMIHSKTMLYGVINENGDRLFKSDDDISIINDLPATIVVQIGSQIMALSELAEIREVEEK